MNKNKNSSGFTLVELLIASVIFSIIVLVATAGIIKIGQVYYKGVTVSKTQEVARSISEELSRAVQFSTASVTEETPAGSLAEWDGIYCFSDSRYLYKINDPTDNATNDSPSINDFKGLIAQRFDNGKSCVDCPVGSSDPDCNKETDQLLAANMRLLDFEVSKLQAANAWNINIRIAYGDNDLLSHYINDRDFDASQIKDATCKQGISASSFCATARLDTIVKRRLNIN